MSNSITDTNYTTRDVGTHTEIIPASRLRVSPLFLPADILITATGGVIAIIGIYLLISCRYPTVAFWVGACEVSFSAPVIILYFALKYHRARSLETLNLKATKTSEDYRARLDVDEEAQYTVTLKDFSQKHICTNQSLGVGLEGLKKQTELDKNRGLHFRLNGKQIEPEELDEKYGDYVIYANQSSLAELVFIMTSRYQHCHVGILVQQRKSDKPNTYFNLVTDSYEEYLEVTQFFEIADISHSISNEPYQRLKYIKATMRIDFNTGDAVVSWASPTDECPSL